MKVIFRTGVLGHHPVVVQAIERDLVVDVRHVPVKPCPSELVVEAVNRRAPSSPAQAVSALQQESLFPYRISQLSRIFQTGTVDKPWVARSRLATSPAKPAPRTMTS